MLPSRATNRVRPSLAIVGASARSAAASAVRAGYRPITADLFADADLRRSATATRISPYPEGLLDWLRTVEPPAWMYTGALENHPELIDQMAWIAPLWGNPGDVLQRVRSPWELADALRDAGLLFPETRPSCDDLPRDGSWLAKTYRGASGSGVREFSAQFSQGGEETRRQRDKETRRIPSVASSPCLPVSLSPGPVFQRRVDGTPCAAVFVASGGDAELLGITRQLVGEDWLGAGRFQYAGSIGPWPVSTRALTTIQQIGHVLAEQFELVGLFGVDMILDEDQVWTLEVNPRYTASVEVVERATGVQAIAAHAAACCESSISDFRLPIASQTYGKAILFAKRDVVVAQALADSALEEALRMPWPTLADVPAAGTLVELGRPILTLFAEGASTAEVEQRLRERVGELLRSIV
jgi:predicted ATP-grasp superfamily ATP-dependent carboligase